MTERAAADADAATADQEAPTSAGTRGDALYFYGVTRVRTWARGRAAEEVTRIRYRDIEAIVRETRWELPPDDIAHLSEHQRILESAMHRGTVLPAPFGIVFRGRRQLIRLLEEQYLVLDEGLSFFEGHWELRLHVTASPSAEPGPVLDDLAMEMYAELRRYARAAVPFAGDGSRVLSAAFLVERNTWVEFIERAEDLGTVHPELSFDITGPWPPYDFVRLV
jgi:hypothetical protein